jgi:hypothetical protein
VIEEAAPPTVQIEILGLHSCLREIIQSPDRSIFLHVAQRHQWRNNHRHDTTSAKTEDHNRRVVVEPTARVLAGPRITWSRRASATECWSPAIKIREGFEVTGFLVMLSSSTLPVHSASFDGRNARWFGTDIVSAADEHARHASSSARRKLPV